MEPASFGFSGGGGGGSGPGSPITTSFVYRSGGGPGNNVYGTWPALMAAMNSAAIQAGTVRFLALDGSNGALHATVGAWNVDNFRITTTAAGSGFATHLTIDDGCVLQGHTLYVSDGATLISQSASTVWETTTADVIVLSERASIQNAAGTAPFFHAFPGRNFTFDVKSYATLGDGVSHVVNLDDATANVNLYAFDGGSVTAHALAGTGTYAAFPSDDGTVSATQDNTGAPNPVTLASSASKVAYTPSVPGNWPVVPTETAQALDELAARPTAAAFNISIVDLAVQSVANNIGGGDQWTTGGANNSIGVGFVITDTTNVHTCTGARLYWRGTVEGSHAITVQLYENQAASAALVAAVVVTPPAADGAFVATFAAAYTLKPGVTYTIGYWSAGTLTIVGNFNSDLSMMFTAFARSGLIQASAFHAYVFPQRNGGGLISPISFFQVGGPAYPSNGALTNYSNPIEPTLT